MRRSVAEERRERSRQRMTRPPSTRASTPRRQAANDLVPGQYVAPTFEFIFPENVKPGDGLVPNDMWHLPFLVNGEGPDVGPLTPAPW